MVRRAGPIDSSARLDLARRAARPWVPRQRSGRQSDVSLREALAVRGRGAIVRRVRPVDSTARLNLNVDQTAPLGLAGRAVRPSVPLRRPGVQSDVSLREALRAHGRGRPADSTARLDLPVDHTARLDLDVDQTARLDPAAAPVRPSVPLGRPVAQSDVSLREALRAHGRGRPADSTARLDLDVDHTERLDPAPRAVRPSNPPRRPGPQNDGSSREAPSAHERGRELVRRARPVDNTERLDPAPRAVRPSNPPRRPEPQNDASPHQAVTVGEANPWGRRVKRTALAFCAVLLFVALVVASARPFGGNDQPAQKSSVSGASSAAAATDQDQRAVSPDRPGVNHEGSSGGALPPAQGVQAFSGEQQAQSKPPVQSDNRLPPWQLLLLNCVLVVLSLGLFTVSGTTLWWMLHAWRSPDALAATGFRRRQAGAPRSFSLLLPARHEQNVLADTIDAMARLDHPDYEVIVIIGHDDPETEFVAREAAARHPRIVRVVMDYHLPKNKPKALNTALRKCRGDIVGVFDAEDEVHPGLLRLVEARFEESGADVVQSGVQLMNVQTSWWSLRNCLEYYFWFRSRLHFHAEKRFIPLGGNTVFTRTKLLRDAGGWDPDCLAEDCEIGVRLSTRGARVAVAYDPEAVTREETPVSIRALVKQRTRWDQGFLQVLRKGEWRKLPSRRQRWLARYTLAMPFLQAATGVLLPLSIASMFLLKVPVPTALVTFIPLAPTLVTVAVESAALGEFGREFGIRIRFRDQARLLLGTFPYQLLLAAAAVRAVFRESRGHGGWEKTTHTNAHRTTTPRQPVPAWIRG
jgi:cellulose synthase/poly-beta-1,6-N-acetylglucosamine synthase-like glycosyltransferase